MKKSKIIIPALALIAFSVAASVTGAVAWFTASRTATISAGSYTVVKTSAELKAVVNTGIGTSVNENKDTVTFNGYLTDGSFDHLEEFVTYPNTSGKAMGGTVDLADATPTTAGILRGTASDTKKIYTVATFDLSFTVSFGATGENVGLFLNNSGTTNTAFTVHDGSAAVTAKGFRMAFVPKSDSANGEAKVLADLQESGKCKFITSKTDSTLGGASYAETDLMHSGYNTAMPTDGALSKADALLRPDYLGFFAFSSGAQVALNFTVVAWFEGTDENIVNQASAALYQQVDAKLVFEAVNLSN